MRENFNFNSCLRPYMKINLRATVDLNTKRKIITFLEENGKIASQRRSTVSDTKKTFLIHI